MVKRLESISVKKIKCTYCGNVWETESKKIFVTCSNYKCKRKVDTRLSVVG